MLISIGGMVILVLCKGNTQSELHSFCTGARLSGLIHGGVTILFNVEGYDRRSFCIGAGFSGLIHGGILTSLMVEGHDGLKFLYGSEIAIVNNDGGMIVFICVEEHGGLRFCARLRHTVWVT